MIGKKFKNLFIVAGLSLAFITAAPGVSRASHYLGKTPASIAVNSMSVDVPVTAVSTKKPVRKHAKHRTVKASLKRHAGKKKAHTTIVYRKHHHKARIVSAKKHSL